MKKGFSLVEVLIVSIILVLVSVGVIASFSSVISSQRYALRSQRLLDQGNYAMDYMSRALKNAKRENGDVECLILGRNYQEYGRGIKFISFEGSLRCKAFYLEDGVIIDYERGRVPEEEIALTSSDVEVLYFEIVIEDSPNIQPKVEISLKIKPSDFDSPELELSTTISQRDLNLPMEE